MPEMIQGIRDSSVLDRESRAIKDVKSLKSKLKKKRKQYVK
jgi:hypothetical protein